MSWLAWSWHGNGGGADITEGESTDILDNAAETKTNDSSWNLYYTVDSSFFKDMDANGWLRIRIGDCGQTAVYINTGTDIWSRQLLLQQLSLI